MMGVKVAVLSTTTVNSLRCIWTHTHKREERDKAVALLAENDVAHAAIGKLLELVQHKQAATMIQRLVEDSDQLKGALGDLGFEHYSALQKLVDQDPDIRSIREGTADIATKKRVSKAFRQAAIADPLRRSSTAQTKHRRYRRLLKVIEDRDIIYLPNGDQLHVMYVCASCHFQRVRKCTPDWKLLTREELIQCNMIMPSGFWEESWYDDETMEGGGGWRCIVSYYKIEVKAAAGCTVCSKIIENIAKANGTTDQQGKRLRNYDVTTWPPIG